MGRSKSNKRKAARSRTSNRRLPTSDVFDLNFNRMVGLPSISSLSSQFFSNVVEEFFGPEPKPRIRRRRPRYPARTRPAEPVPLSKALWQPKDVTPVVAEPKARPLDTCVARSQRTEVIHATGRAGKRGQKSPLWTEKSKIKC